MVCLLASVWVYLIWGINDMSDVLPFRSYSSLIDHSYFKHTLYASYSILRRISYLPNLSPPRNMAQNYFAATISKLFVTLVNEESFITWCGHMIKSCKNNGSTISSFLSRTHQSCVFCCTFKNSSEFLILVHFCKLCLQS